ncbi:Branched-chain amino acid transport ATP-binding protein LivF (TC 3.A.1.4.1) [Olavius algarvensis Delta 1 endosymbiont]|nr:Branched-chain amino acid transport ATP-binding protein LivF (TC 3.A.1.4.1) [Olavius algarvensis Delta 1 endosymbiont]
MPANILEVNHLTAGYGDVQVLRDVSVSLSAGEKVGIFGPNGHGKTTLLRTISGLVKARTGEIIYRQTDIANKTPRAIVGRGLIHVSQGNTLFPRMTVKENLILSAYHRTNWRLRGKRMTRVFEIFPALAERRNQLSSTLSGGERQMLAIGMGLMAGLEILMLDEPSLGLAPVLKDVLGRAVAEITSQGVTLILVEQDVEFMLELTDRFYLIEDGQVALEGANDTIDHQEILAMYFGASA